MSEKIRKVTFKPKADNKKIDKVGKTNSDNEYPSCVKLNADPRFLKKFFIV